MGKSEENTAYREFIIMRWRASGGMTIEGKRPDFSICSIVIRTGG